MCVICTKFLYITLLVLFTQLICFKFAPVYCYIQCTTLGYFITCKTKLFKLYMRYTSIDYQWCLLCSDYHWWLQCSDYYWWLQCRDYCWLPLMITMLWLPSTITDDYYVVITMYIVDDYCVVTTMYIVDDYSSDYHQLLGRITV